MGMAMLGTEFQRNKLLIGIDLECVDDDQLDAAMTATTDILKRTSPDAMVRIRQSIDGASTSSFVDQLAVEMEHQSFNSLEYGGRGASLSRKARPAVRWASGRN